MALWAVKDVMERSKSVGFQHANEASGPIVPLTSHASNFKTVSLNEWEKDAFHSHPAMRQTDSGGCQQIHVLQPIENRLIEWVIVPSILVPLDMPARTLKDLLL
jgi:hypothetical protein